MTDQPCTIASVFFAVDSLILLTTGHKTTCSCPASVRIFLLNIFATNFTFAGYGKMPGYEHVFTDFLLSLAEKDYKRRPSYSSGEG